MILPTDTPAQRAAAVQEGARLLRAGALLGLPTETVYGLAADADNAQAVAQIFATKGRPADHPLIVHLAAGADAVAAGPHVGAPGAGPAQAADGAVGAPLAPNLRQGAGVPSLPPTLEAGVAHYCDHLPDFARALMAAFWPGPLTLIVRRRAGVAVAAAGGQDSVGLRCPAHPLAQALLQALRAPPAGEPVVWGLAAPSANRFGRVSPTHAAHVQSEFDGQVVVLDGGDCDVGIESTIVDCTRGQPVLLRPGAITPAQMEAVCGHRVLCKEDLPAQLGQAPRASGTLESHYAPRARVRLMDAAGLQAALTAPVAPGAVAVYARTALALPPGVLRQTMPEDAAAAAHELFAVLRALDENGVQAIWVEAPPAGAAWDGVRDRLQRAAA